jgi:hypothetical protein
MSVKRSEGPTFIQTCVMMDKPVKYNRFAKLKHTSVSHLINTAAEEYLKRCAEDE